MPIFENRKKMLITQPYREWGGGDKRGRGDQRNRCGKGARATVQKKYLFLWCRAVRAPCVSALTIVPILFKLNLYKYTVFKNRK